jgi:dTDP-4-amino-4,6-dideoxygalactose transaminase
MVVVGKRCFGEIKMANLAINGGEKTVPDGILTPWPIITDEDKKMVMECMESGIFTGPYGPQVRGAETEFAEYLGVKHVLMVNSGTAALHMAVAVAGIGPGDEVIVPSFTFLATALAVLHNNAVPVFVDIEPRAFMLDPSKIEGRITSRTKAIIPVHLHGQCADMDAINEIAKKHNLIVIEDTAQAHGAKYKGKLAGTLGDMSIFSVQASKNLASGEGGFFVTNNDEMANFANRMRLFGQDASFEDEKLIS